MIRIGIGGWSYEGWRGTFYPGDLPQRDELHFASRCLTSIEINATYYRTQTPASFARWRDTVPDGFVLALKAPRYATNRKVLAEAGDSVARFLASGITELGDRLGPINWQLPATRAFDPDDFAAFLALLPPDLDGRPLRHAIEARHPGFSDDRAAALCRARGIAMVRAIDGPYPQIDAATAGFSYLRLMGTTDRPQGYDDAALDRHAATIRGLDAAGDVHVYVISGAKARNPAAAMALIDRIGGAPA